MDAHREKLAEVRGLQQPGSVEVLRAIMRDQLEEMIQLVVMRDLLSWVRLMVEVLGR